MMPKQIFCVITSSPPHPPLVCIKPTSSLSQKQMTHDLSLTDTNNRLPPTRAQTPVAFVFMDGRVI